MTTEQPTRLVHEEPEFARLIAASKNEAPPSEQVEKALSLATQIAAKTRWSSWHSLGSNLAIGLAVIGATALVAVVGTGALRPDEAVAPPVVASPTAQRPCSAEPCAPDRAREGESEGPTPTSDVEKSVVTVSVDDLAPVPPEMLAVAPRRTPERTAAPGTTGHSGATTPPREHAEPSASGPESGGAATTFAEEVALVGAARAALERHDIPSCMRAVRTYEERFGSGTFAHEIEVLRIEALFASGERSRARAAAAQFVTENANSPYADRVNSLLERSKY